jgi:hypothetical protein
MRAVLRRNDVVLMVCGDCRVSAAIPAADWDSTLTPAKAAEIPTVSPRAF